MFQKTKQTFDFLALLVNILIMRQLFRFINNDEASGLDPSIWCTEPNASNKREEVT